MIHDEVCQILVELGILTRGQIQDTLDSLPRDLVVEPQMLLKELVRCGKLTRFQAHAIYRGNATALKLGSYLIEERLGRGGFGTVYRACHLLMDRTVAIKVVNNELLEDRSAIDRFLREVRTAAKLTHPNIVKAFDASQHEGSFFLVMEYVEGQLLSELLEKDGSLPIELAVDYVIQTAKGLEYAHRQGIVHRDIKPSNLILDTEGRIRILDVGLARFEDVEDVDRGESSRKVVAGTRDFMSPEQALGRLNVDRRTDVYSLGCTLYALLTGDVMYPGNSESKKTVDHQISPAPKLNAKRPDAPEELAAIFQRMVSKHPKDRYQSMVEVITDLRLFVGSQFGKPLSDEASGVFFVDKSKAAKETSQQEASLPKNGNSNEDSIEKNLALSAAGRALKVVPVRNGDAPHSTKSRWFQTQIVGIAAVVCSVAGCMFVTCWPVSSSAKTVSARVSDGDDVMADRGESKLKPLDGVAKGGSWHETPVSAFQLSLDASIPAENVVGSRVWMNEEHVYGDWIVRWSNTFDNVSDGMVVATNVELNQRLGSTVSRLDIFNKPTALNLPFRATIAEDSTGLGCDGRPGVLRTVLESHPDNNVFIGFKLGGAAPQSFFTIPGWVPGSVDLQTLEGTLVDFQVRAIRPSTLEDIPLTVDFRLEQDHISNYESRLGLGTLYLTSQWQTVRRRLDSAENVQKFLEVMQRSQSNGVNLIWSLNQQDMVGGDIIELDNVRFLSKADEQD